MKKLIIINGIDRGVQRLELYNNMNTVKIDVSDITPKQTVIGIFKLIEKVETEMKEYEIIKVEIENYSMFDDMVFWRMNRRERTYTEKLEAANRNFRDVYLAFENSNLYVYAALYNDKFVGWISIIYMPKVGRLNGLGYIYVDELWVEPIYRKQGIANKLMRKADELLNITASAGVRLYVNTENPNAKGFNEKCGKVAISYNKMLPSALAGGLFFLWYCVKL